MAVQRLDKILVHMGVCSRKEAVLLARSGKIAVNGVICKTADCKIDPEQDKLVVNDQEVCYRAHWYLMLNKPAGVITATEDRQQETVLDLLPPELRKLGLFPVGRLDKDTEGLLILTTDGAFSHALMSPKKHVSKRYQAHVEGEPALDAIQRFAEGMMLKDGTQCRAAVLELSAPGVVYVTLQEGKFHQVKRMLAAVGCKVTKLCRISIGALLLDECLSPGQWRELTEQEKGLLQAEKEK